MSLFIFFVGIKSLNNEAEKSNCSEQNEEIAESKFIEVLINPYKSFDKVDFPHPFSPERTVIPFKSISLLL